MWRDEICLTCAELERTSDEQVALRCRWHCGKGGSIIRCHVLPLTPACPRWHKKAAYALNQFVRHEHELRHMALGGMRIGA